MKKLVWDLEGDLVLPEQVTTVSGYPVFITSIDNGVLKVRYSKDGMSAVAPAGTIGAHWEDVPLLFKQSPGDWPEDFDHENGQYQCTCTVCKAQFTGYKRRVVCKCCVDSGRAVQDRSAGVPIVCESFSQLRINGQVVEPRTIRSMELYQHFQAFRYAEVTVRGLGPAFQNAVAFIDKEVAIRVAEALGVQPLKGIK